MVNAFAVLDPNMTNVSYSEDMWRISIGENLKTVLMLLDNGPAKVKPHVLSMLVQCARNDKLLKQMLEAGAINSIIPLLEDSENNTLQERVSLLLALLSGGGDASYRFGLLPRLQVIFACLKSKSDKTVENILLTLSRLSSDSKHQSNRLPTHPPTR